MKALSLRQPWAWLVAAGLKDVENRTWSTKFRGRFLIHAGKSSEIEVQGLGDQWILNRLAGGNLERYWNAELVRGAIIGEATLVDCKFRPTEDDGVKYPLWSEPGLYFFVLADPLLYDFPVVCRGALGFFDPHFNIAPPQQQPFYEAKA